MDDVISRKQAIDAIESIDWYHQNRNKDMVSGANSAEHQAWYKAEDVYQALELLPSAQPERKKGNWILIADGYTDYVKCDQCGNISYVERNFCSSCGADMREEGEQE